MPAGSYMRTIQDRGQLPPSLLGDVEPAEAEAPEAPEPAAEAPESE